ncbi:MAG: hypothetical protein WCU00_13080, partial [Candidatus Latescibacterota bacterium]
MSFSGGYRFSNFEGEAEAVVRDFSDAGPLQRENRPLDGHVRAPWHLNRDGAIELFHRSGCQDFYPVRFETAVDFDRIQNIIVNAVHNSLLDRNFEPGIFDDDELFANGLKTLRVLFPSARITIAINKRSGKWFETEVVHEFAAVRVMSDRYPQEFPVLLRRDILNVPVGKNDESILVIPFLDVIQTAESMTRGKTLTDRILLVAGPGVSKPGWYRIPIGTHFEDIRKHLLKSEEYGPWRIIRGDALTGAVVTPDDNTVKISDREITVIREHASRDFYRFLNPGFTYD